MLRQVKPRNARSKRALEKREPKAIENPKTCLFLRGTTCSQIVQDALTDLHAMRQPLAKKFTKKNPIHPFDDASSLEFFSEKNDTSLIVFGSSSKKRPHTLTFVRTFSYKVYDMLELYLNAESFRTLSQFRTKKFAVGLKPMLLFAGTAFESPVANEFTLAKSMLLDFFRGETSDKIDVEGLQYIVSITAEDIPGEGDAKPPIHLRTYLIRTRRSGQRLPRVEVEEMGPRMDFRVGRTKEPDEATRKEAMKKPRGTEERTKKNISTSSMGDKMGRVHVNKQDFGKMQTRKMKGLKRPRAEQEGELTEELNGDDAKRVRQ
ncbi:Ribosome biogenesis protein-like protein [Hapsidospora chrysogenum ATCC 11550]|uniref:Ribosome production factor 2 homolog n=1 Tax=Hapsidospora chrysogenum (strain ATCC 11550 / CBS 779.69 / DSM 880 / IAM 14645 / JCM 23072 / IMI 49137) TaxID=857340 RepID=A0A086SW76_HAPC1|nr:Ribosome biogenesis protein-like protein [Hapsidospora chrysogenum ATCC 11550]